jgi:Uma2 family endonuclease
MYDLPSEEVGDSGVPDEFHILQPELLRLTFCPPDYFEDEVFVATDLNLYYDARHPQWYKRPDWFGVLGVSRLYEACNQFSISPFACWMTDLSLWRTTKSSAYLIKETLSRLSCFVPFQVSAHFLMYSSARSRFLRMLSFATCHPLPPHFEAGLF